MSLSPANASPTVPPTVPPAAPVSLGHRLCTAPMLDHTDRHCRYLFRLLSPHAFLYTEMVTTGALRFGNVPRHLAFHPAEHPVALQLGGSAPEGLAHGARIAAEYGYDEVNLNCGCPSPRVAAGAFGACLMREPGLVAECVAALADAGLPVSVKCRLGVDDDDSPEFLHRFTAAVVGAGCHTLIVHARKAILHGLSPKENREIPPLDYPRVHRLKEAWPDLSVVLNGGLRTVPDILAALAGGDGAPVDGIRLDGAMVGRAFLEAPMLLGAAEAALWPPGVPGSPEGAAATRAEVYQGYRDYVAARLAEGVPLAPLCRPLLPLFQGEPGARRFRRCLSEGMTRPGAGLALLDLAAAALPSLVGEEMATN